MDTNWGGVKLEFHGTDTDTDILREDPRTEVGVSGDFPVQLATSRIRTTILADLSADLSDTRAFLREDVRWGCARVHKNSTWWPIAIWKIEKNHDISKPFAPILA